MIETNNDLLRKVICRVLSIRLEEGEANADCRYLPNSANFAKESKDAPLDVQVSFLCIYSLVYFSWQFKGSNNLFTTKN